jgi:membrane-associated protein
MAFPADAVELVLQYVVRLDAHLPALAETLGGWSYAAIGATVFLETGLVVAPFLPGESVLLTSGTLAGAGILDIVVLAPLLLAAAFLGDVSSYLIGRLVGRHLVAGRWRLLRPEHVERAHLFYQRHGGLAIVLARFLPVVRTLAPFAAGVARMDPRRFLAYAGVASTLWVTVFVGAGYGFGSAAWVKEYLLLALLAVIAASALPGLVVSLVRLVRRRPRGEAGVAGTRTREDASKSGIFGHRAGGPVGLARAQDNVRAKE